MSNEYRLAIVIDANGRPAVAAIDRVTGATRGLETAQRTAAGGADRLSQANKRAEGELQSLGNTARRVHGFLLTVFGGAVLQQVISTTTRLDGMRRTLEGVLGGGAAAARGIAFVRSETERLGIAFEPALQGFTRLAAAANGTPLAPRVQELTAAVLQAGRAYNLTGEEIGGAITAMEQIISKGTVSAEELRGQLGERIPGAFQIAARAIGVTTAELDQMLSKGQVVATDFLPKFARELQRSTAAAAGLNAASPAAELARIGNALQGIAADIGQGIFDGLGRELQGFREQLQQLDASNIGRQIGETLGAIARNADVAVAGMAAFAGARGVGAAVVALQALGVVAKPVPTAIAAAGAAFQALNVPVASNAVALTGWTRAATVATTIGRGLFALIGGWPGLLAAAGAGIYYMSQSQTAAQTTADALRDSIEELNAATEAQIPAAERSARAHLEESRTALAAAQSNYELAKAKLAAAQSNTGTSQGSLAIRGGQTFEALRGMETASADMARLTQEINKAEAALGRIDGRGAKLDKLWKSFDKVAGVNKLLGSLQSWLGLVEESTDRVSGVSGDAADASQKYIESLQEQIDTLGMSRAEQIRWEAASKAAKAATQAQSQEILRLGEVLARGVEEQEALTEAQRAAEQQADALARANQQLEAAYAALVDPLRNVAEAQRNFEQLNDDLFRLLAGPGAQAMQQYQEDLAVIQRYLEAMYGVGPLPAEQAAQLEANAQRAADAAKRALDESMREVARNAGTNFEETFRRAFENGIKGASLDDFWTTITEGFRRAVEEGGVQGAANFIAGGVDMLGGAVNAFRSAGGGARGAAAAAAQLPIPIVQPIARALGVIDQIFGGRLFGTSWETRGSSTNLGITGGVATGSQSVQQSRQRSLFRGTQRRTQTTQLSGEALDAINSLVSSAEQALASAARTVGGSVPELLAFGFRQEFDSKGNLIRETATIAGQQFTESLEQAAARYVGRNVLTLLETIDPALSAVSARFASTGVDVLDFANAMLLAQTDIKRGTALIADGTLSEIGTLLEGLQGPGEAIAETYQRVWSSSQLYLQALGALDGQMQTATAEVVQFGVGVVDALGGLDAAAAQFNQVLETFFTDAERAALRLTEAQGRANREMQTLGIEGVDRSNYRSQFEAARAAGLTPEEFAAWVRLGVAISDASSAAAELAGNTETVTESYIEQTSAVVDLSEAGNEAAEAMRQLAEFTLGINDELASLSREGMNDFVAGIQDVQQWTADSITRANELARAAGFQGAAEETLAQIHQISAVRIGRAIAELERATAGLIESLYAEVDAADGADLSRSNDPLAFVTRLFRGINETAAELDPQRYQQALTVAQNLFNLSWATGVDALDIGERMKLPFDRFLRDLGVDLGALSDASNFDGLVAAARALGVELPDLASRIGVNLGLLSDSSSLLNDGFERVLSSLSESQAAPIRALLRQLETAPEADRAGIRGQIETAVNALPAELRALFAPFLDNVDITPPEQEAINATDRVTTAVTAGNTLLQQILTAIEAGTPTPGKPGVVPVRQALPGEKGAGGVVVDLGPVAVAVNSARAAQVEELEHVGREVRNLQGVAGVTNDLLSQVLSELRRQREQLVTVGVGLKRR